MFDAANLHADINSGHAFEVWGVIGDLWFWVSKLPYETEWRGFFREQGDHSVEYKIKGDDVVQAINSGFELHKKVKASMSRRTLFHNFFYDSNCPYCLRGHKHDQAKHEAALRRVYEASR